MKRAFELSSFFLVLPPSHSTSADLSFRNALNLGGRKKKKVPMQRKAGLVMACESCGCWELESFQLRDLSVSADKRFHLNKRLKYMRKFNMSNLIFACWELNFRKQLIHLFFCSFAGFGCSSVLVPDTDKINYKIQLPDNRY